MYVCVTVGSPASSQSGADTQSSSTRPALRPHTRIRPDYARGDNPKHLPSHLVESHRAHSFSGASTTGRSTPTSSNRITAFATSSNHKSALPSQKGQQSSQLKQHRASVPTTDQELARTLTSLNIATFDPMLPPSLGQRSSTFVGQKRQMTQLRAVQSQFTTVSRTG